MVVLQTERLSLRRLTIDDAAFILELVNDPAWIRFIGDKGVRTLRDAESYILNGPVDMYARLGFGLYLVELKQCRRPVGLCGLLKRAELDDVDLGFAIHADFRQRGFAYESAKAVMTHARSVLGVAQVLAITSPDNEASGRLLENLGFYFERMMRLGAEVTEVRMWRWRSPSR